MTDTRRDNTRARRPVPINDRAANGWMSIDAAGRSMLTQDKPPDNPMGWICSRCSQVVLFSRDVRDHHDRRCRDAQPPIADRPGWTRLDGADGPATWKCDCDRCFVTEVANWEARISDHAGMCVQHGPGASEPVPLCHACGCETEDRLRFGTNIHCRACFDTKARDFRPTPTKIAASVVRPMTDALGGLKRACDQAVELSKTCERKKVWGDMRTPRDTTGGTLFATGEDGPERLYLERLDTDRLEALEQVSDAAYEAAVSIADQKACPAMERRMADMEAAFCALHTAISDGWPLDPYLQTVRDAHEAIGIEREWQDGEVSGAEVREHISAVPVALRWAGSAPAEIVAEVHDLISKIVRETSRPGYRAPDTIWIRGSVKA